MLGSMHLPHRRRHAVSTLLALLLAVESVAAVSAAAATTQSARDAGAHALPAETPDTRVLAAAGTRDRTWEPGLAQPATQAELAVPDAPDYLRPRLAAAASDAPAAEPEATPTPVATPAATPQPVATPTPRPAATPTPGPVAKPTPKPPTAQPVAPPQPTAPPAPAPAAYTGSNRLWIPSLGITRPVSFFPCDRATAPDNYVYLWGCAGSNNVYLLGHASGVFRPLNSAYASGRLKVGLKAVYADAAGSVHTYAVQFWRLVRPDGDVGWAYEAQATPSMTLQTCVGANSEYRLVVRLVQVD